jgi:tRNA pseudouridine65 synthase
MFDLLYEDDHYVAINKPTNILVHRTAMSEDRVFVLQYLREQLGIRPFTVHRLDRATSGVLIFGKNAGAAGALGRVFMDKSVEKKYLAVVRGFTDEQGTIDYALSDAETGKPLQPAVTHYRRLAESELPWAIGNKYPTARFSLVEIEPETGRRQQIRKHFAHIFHPIIGDKRHGDNKHNNYFFETLDIRRLLLHASRLAFTHPYTGQLVVLTAPPDALFSRALDLLNLPAPPDISRPPD